MATSQLLDALIESVQANNAPVRDVRVGVSWTAVHGKYCGLAKTYGVPVKHGNYTRDMGRLTEKTTLELVEYARSWNLIEASIGVAALNAMITPIGKSDLNARDFILDKCAGRRVVMVGSFPFTPDLKKIAAGVYVLELDPAILDPAENIVHESAAEHLIPECDIMVMTGSTLINKSIDRLLALAREHHCYTILLGPSTPMSTVFFEYGVDVLAGAEVREPEAIMRKLSQSGGMLNSRVCKDEIIFRMLIK